MANFNIFTTEVGDLATIPLIKKSTTSAGMSVNLEIVGGNTVTISEADDVWETVLDITSGRGFLRGATLYGSGGNIGGYIEMKITIDGFVYQLQAPVNDPAGKTYVSTVAMIIGEASSYIPLPTLLHRFTQSLKIEARKKTTGASLGYTHSLDRE